ncbi:MAG: rhodanese-like domain-containing protein [Chloroflexi bacterium]|nr:rhodanese-like domain-containing protein [Chloroflexota bacterium]
MKQRSILPILLIVIGAVIVFTAISISGQPRSETPTPPPLVSEEESFPEVPRVSLKEALTAHEGGAAIFIDVRDGSAYETSHVSGSLSFPLGQLESRLKELNPNAWIITYCT